MITLLELLGIPPTEATPYNALSLPAQPSLPIPSGVLTENNDRGKIKSVTDNKRRLTKSGWFGLGD